MNDTIEKTPTPELSKRVLDDRKDGDRLTAMANEHAVKVSRAVGATLGEEHRKPVEALVKALADRVATMSAAMVAADVALTVELADDAAPRNERDLQEKLTREAIVDVRERLTGMYGPGILSKLLLASAAPKDPKLLVTFALRAADAIEPMKPGDFPESKIEGGRPSPKKWAGLLRKHADALDGALKSIDREAAEAVTATTERNETRGAFESFAPRASDLLEGFLRFADMDAEADRLARPIASASSAGATEPEPAPPTQ